MSGGERVRVTVGVGIGVSAVVGNGLRVLPHPVYI
jgi:hypothetical protein